jgi:peptide/nickel transport system ATP-binding protein
MNDEARREPVLRVADLRLAYRVDGELRETIRGLSFQVERGEAYALVGESGCGKSTVAFAAVHYLPDNTVHLGGQILLAGQDIRALSWKQRRLLRKSVVSMVYQNAATALNPTIRIGDQVAEVFLIRGFSRAEAWLGAEDAVRKVRISDVGKVLQSYPQQLSGGMQQRVVIAMAISASPELIILDEPTTGLDATVEAEILELLENLRQELKVALLFISHNLAVVAQLCDRVGTLYAGRMVEEGSTSSLLFNPHHPYTASLLRCLPKRGADKWTEVLTTIEGLPPKPGSILKGCVFAGRCTLVQPECRKGHPEGIVVGQGQKSWCIRATEVPAMAFEQPKPAPRADQKAPPLPPVIEVRNLSKSYGHGPNKVQILSDVSFAIRHQEVLGIVGESGSGKSTLAKVIVGLEPADPGSALMLMGRPMARLLEQRDPAQAGAIQMVFQDPSDSLNPKHKVKTILSRTATRALRLTASDARQRTFEVAKSVKLDPSHVEYYPGALSGGLRQRVAIGRAIAGKPQFVVCDEPTSALDVSVQAAILNLLVDLQRHEGLSFIFVSHDLDVVRYISDRIMVLYFGRVMEIGPAEAVFSGPHHPYTEALLSAAAHLERKEVSKNRARLRGEPPTHRFPPGGCVFHTRCPRKLGNICEEKVPPRQIGGNGHEIACHIPVSQLGRTADAR